MNIETPRNVSFFDYVGGVQLLRGEDISRTALPVILIGICASGAVGNLLVLLVFTCDFRHGRGSEVKALLGALVSVDLMVLLLCAPVRAVTYYKQTWTLGRFVCRTADWLQHACVVAKTLLLAGSTVARHNLVASTANGPHFSPKRIHGVLALVLTVSMIFPIPQMQFAAFLPNHAAFICVSEIPVCASDFMNVFYKIYPTVAYALPAVFTVAYYTRSLYAAVNHDAPHEQQQSKVTLVLLCVSGANAVMLLPEWATFTWTRLGYSRPPVGVTVLSQALVYVCSALSPVLLMTMYDDVRRGLVILWGVATCKGSTKQREEQRQPQQQRPPATATADSDNKAPETTGNGASSDAEVNSQDAGKTFPDVEHFWTGRTDTDVVEEQDPVPWESGEKVI